MSKHLISYPFALSEEFKSYIITPKILNEALMIYRRLIASIPVILMGHTGCGKTALVRLLSCVCNTQLVHIRVHGGYDEIRLKKELSNAVDRAMREYESTRKKTFVFLDEVNTCHCLGLFKELLCDHSVGGVSLNAMIGRAWLSRHFGSNSHSGHLMSWVAAVNPYIRRTDKEIARFSHAGLKVSGSHHGILLASDKSDLSNLLYRVHPLPATLAIYCWPLHNMDSKTETRCIEACLEKLLPPQESSPQAVQRFASLVATAHRFMRNHDSDCRFVSFRDVHHAGLVFRFWKNVICPALLTHSQAATSRLNGVPSCFEKFELQALIVGVCTSYAVKLSIREPLYVKLALCLCEMKMQLSGQEVATLFESEQLRLAQQLNVPAGISLNRNLVENMFMMIMAILLRIPLFIVGPPGTSKSLAKSLVSDVCLGAQSPRPFFRNLPACSFFSLQCSPQTRSKDLEAQFERASKFHNNDDTSIACVVLEEIGLAEMSIEMPLKILHERFDSELQNQNAPAFLGLSNWALDPAKMNRGFFVTRSPPSASELTRTALDICSCVQSDGSSDLSFQAMKLKTEQLLEPVLEALAFSFLEATCLIEEDKSFPRPIWFALRDFYSCCTFINEACQKKEPAVEMIAQAIGRNFSGLPFNCQRKVDLIFDKAIQSLEFSSSAYGDEIYQRSNKDVIKNIKAAYDDSHQSRYPLVVTDDPPAAVGMLQSMGVLPSDTIVFIGSAFPADREYESLCRMLARFKVCLESGKSVVLISLNDLYESLYDVLNKYYTSYGEHHFVDLSLGHTRVKTMVHPEFRLMVVAPSQDVFHRIPAPLLNRFEKQYLDFASLLPNEAQPLVQRVLTWRQQLEDEAGRAGPYLFVGHGLKPKNVVAGVVLHVWKGASSVPLQQELEQECENILLLCAAPEGLLSLPFRRSMPIIAQKEKHFSCRSLPHVMNSRMLAQQTNPIFATTNSFPSSSANIQKEFKRYAADHDIKQCAWQVESKIECLNVNDYATEQGFSDAFKSCVASTAITIVQIEMSRNSVWMVHNVQFIIRDHQAQKSTSVSSSAIALLLHVRQPQHVFPSHFKSARKMLELARCYDGFWFHVHVDSLFEPEFPECDVLAKAVTRTTIQNIVETVPKPILLRCLTGLLPFALSQVEFPSFPGAQALGSTVPLCKRLEWTQRAFAGQADVLISRVIEAIKETHAAEARTSDEPTFWLHTMATRSSAVSTSLASGSFRAAVAAAICEDLTLALSVVLAHLDVHGALQVSEIKDYQDEKTLFESRVLVRLWQAVARSPLLCPFSELPTKDVPLPAPTRRALQHVARRRVIIAQPSAGLEPIQFPFSWLFFHQVQNACAISAVPAVDLDTAVLQVIQDNPLFAEMRKVCHSISKSKLILSRYCRDLLVLYPSGLRSSTVLVRGMLCEFLCEYVYAVVVVREMEDIASLFVIPHVCLHQSIHRLIGLASLLTVLSQTLPLETLTSSWHSYLGGLPASSAVGSLNLDATLEYLAGCLAQCFVREACRLPLDPLQLALFPSVLHGVQVVLQQRDVSPVLSCSAVNSFLVKRLQLLQNLAGLFDVSSSEQGSGLGLFTSAFQSVSACLFSSLRREPEDQGKFLDQVRQASNIIADLNKNQAEPIQKQLDLMQTEILFSLVGVPDAYVQQIHRVFRDGKHPSLFSCLVYFFYRCAVPPGSDFFDRLPSEELSRALACPAWRAPFCLAVTAYLQLANPEPPVNHMRLVLEQWMEQKDPQNALARLDGKELYCWLVAVGSLKYVLHAAANWLVSKSSALTESEAQLFQTLKRFCANPKGAPFSHAVVFLIQSLVEEIGGYTCVLDLLKHSRIMELCPWLGDQLGTSRSHIYSAAQMLWASGPGFSYCWKLMLQQGFSQVRLQGIIDYMTKDSNVISLPLSSLKCCISVAILLRHLTAQSIAESEAPMKIEQDILEWILSLDRKEGTSIVHSWAGRLFHNVLAAARTVSTTAALPLSPALVWTLHCSLSVSCSPSSLIRSLGALVANWQPGCCTHYLPAMPEDETLLAFQSLARDGLRVWSCPNGHKYSIGECGRPMQKGRCIECGAPIGGERHAEEKGNRLSPTAPQITEERGHMDDASSDGVTRLSPLSATVLRCLLRGLMVGFADTSSLGLKQRLLDLVDGDINTVARLRCSSREDAVVYLHVLAQGLPLVESSVNAAFLTKEERNR
eukprot:gb/GEZN01000045.1/.p1 GENE.gb/GEZN01000045.1/~~gb/GEZN01000045.1/.p1  ORF type:complete len:2432 (-),score=183.99 gb/GEZN01000045.1/:2366-8932(-)